MSRYAFALKPKWILGHVIAVAFVVVAINMAFWQISRLHDRQAYNERVAANMAAPAAPLEGMLGASSGFDDVPDVLFRHATATGHYLVDQEMVITGQADDEGVPGVWIVTPLRLDDGRVVLVNRGWLPSTGTITAPPADAAPPSGRVTVSGLISETQTKIAGESPETTNAHQQAFLRIDVARIQKQFPEKLVPAFLQRTAQRPADPGPVVPESLAVPRLSNGPHLSYTMQWFVFALVVVIGYPFLLWLIARDRGRERRRGGDATRDDLPPGAFIDADGVIDLTGVDRSGDRIDRPGTGTDADVGVPTRR